MLQGECDVAVVYATFPSAEVAIGISRPLVERGLVACANLLPAMSSVYVWQGKLETGSEHAVLLKTRQSLAGAVVTAVKAAHPYENPAILVLPVAGGSAPFLAWIREQTRPGDPGPGGRLR